MQVEKRGRGRGFFGFLRGHPWAERRLELHITYTKSSMQYYKDNNELRDDINLMGASAVQLQDGSTICEEKTKVVQITLLGGESILFACFSEADLKKALKALEHCGNTPGPVDRLAEKLRLDVLMKDHERILYGYIEFKGTKLPGGLDPNFDPTKKGVLTLELLNEWEALIETVFPKLYTKNSDTAQMEVYQQQEFSRKIDMHNIEYNTAKESFADEKLIQLRLDDKTFQDKVVYVMEKEARLLEEIQELATRYNQ